MIVITIRIRRRKLPAHRAPVTCACISSPAHVVKEAKHERLHQRHLAQLLKGQFAAHRAARTLRAARRAWRGSRVRIRSSVGSGSGSGEICCGRWIGVHEAENKPAEIAEFGREAAVIEVTPCVARCIDIFSHGKLHRAQNPDEFGFLQLPI